MTGREDELGRMLRAVLEKEGDAMQIDTRGASQRLERELSRTKRRRAVVAAFGAAAAVVLGFVLWNSTSSSPPSVPAQPPSSADGSDAPYFLDISTNVQTPLPKELVPQSAQDLSLTYSQDGMAVAVACEPFQTCSGRNKLEVVRPGGRLTVIPVPSDRIVWTHAWSRDGSMLLYRLTRTTTDLGELFVYDLDRAASTQIADLGRQSVYWIDLRGEFSPDGQTVIFHRPRDKGQASPLDVWTVPVTGGEPTLVFRDAAQPEFLPDGRRIAFVQPDSTSLVGRVVASAAPGDSSKPLFEVPEDIVSFHLSPDGKRALVNGSRLVDIATSEVSELACAPCSGQWAGNGRLLVTPER
jgi:dipeptidyl aminopeptidase/acylaminoacyl peptidase